MINIPHRKPYEKNSQAQKKSILKYGKDGFLHAVRRYRRNIEQGTDEQGMLNGCLQSVFLKVQCLISNEQRKTGRFAISLTQLTIEH